MHKAKIPAQASSLWSFASIALTLLLGGASRVGAQDTTHSIPAMDTHAILRAVGSLYRIDPDLLEAIAAVESRGNPDAISPKGARGLMQLMPATAHRFGVSNSFDPVENALGAARFLDHLRSQQEESRLPELLAAYNAGQAPVTKYHGVPPYAETRAYVRQVLLRYLFDRSPSESSSDVTQVSAKAIDPAGSISGRQDPMDQLGAIRRQRNAALLRSRVISPEPVAK
jgi:transglycosylase-like protein with SLT domain